MRLLAASSLVLVLSACQSNSGVGLHLDSVMDARTQGVVLHDGGTLGNAAMWDQICVFDQSQAEVIGDFDLGTTEEKLFDAHGDLALASADGQLFALPRTTMDSAQPVLDVVPLDARVLDNGVSALIDQDGICAVAFDTDTTQAVFELADMPCNDTVAFAADRTTGTAFVADGSTLAVVTVDGQATFFPGEAADMLAWDAVNNAILLATRGSDLVRSADPSGHINWGIQVQGSVFDLDAAETQGLATVMVDQGTVGGELVLIDAETGTQLVSHLTPDAADVTFASDGLSMGIVTTDSVYLYSVDPDARPMATPTAAQAADLGQVIGTGSAVGGSILAAAGAAVFIE